MYACVLKEVTFVCHDNEKIMVQKTITMEIILGWLLFEGEFAVTVFSLFFFLVKAQSPLPI